MPGMASTVVAAATRVAASCSESQISEWHIEVSSKGDPRLAPVVFHLAAAQVMLLHASFEFDGHSCFVRAVAFCLWAKGPLASVMHGIVQYSAPVWWLCCADCAMLSCTAMQLPASPAGVRSLTRAAAVGPAGQASRAARPSGATAWRTSS
jgi:hypothetical protein